MMRLKTWTMGIAAVAVAGAAWATPVNGVGDGSGSTRLQACSQALRDAARDSDLAATIARRELNASSVLVTAQVSSCDCEEDPAATPASRWRCLAPWQIVAMPERR